MCERGVSVASMPLPRHRKWYASEGRRFKDSERQQLHKTPTHENGAGGYVLLSESPFCISVSEYATPGTPSSCICAGPMPRTTSPKATLSSTVSRRAGFTFNFNARATGACWRSLPPECAYGNGHMGSFSGLVSWAFWSRVCSFKLVRAEALAEPSLVFSPQEHSHDV